MARRVLAAAAVTCGCAGQRAPTQYNEHPGKQPFWLRAHRTLRDHPRATLQLSDPDVWTVDNLLTDDDVDRLTNYLSERMTQRDPAPQWCFSPAMPQQDGDKLAPWKDHDFDADPRGSNRCFEHHVGMEIAGLDEQQTSRSTAVVRGDAAFFDELARTLEALVGLDPKHACECARLQPPGRSTLALRTILIGVI